MRPWHLAPVILAVAVLGAAGPAGGAPRSADPAPSLMPLDPEVVGSYRARGLAVPTDRTEARFAGRPRSTVNRVTRPTALAGTASTASTAGTAATTVRAIVLLVGFTDTPPGGPEARFRSTVWDSMLFADTYIRGGADTTTIRTLKRYYQAASYGTVEIVTLDLPGSVGWFTAPHEYTYYCDGDNGFGPYPNNVQRLVMDAVLAADPYVDFSQYAADGVVRNLFVVHAGSGAEWSGGGTLIWSHAWSIAVDDGFGTTPPALYVDGVRVADYSMEPEAGGDTVGEAGAPVEPLLPTVGVYAHEFGHVLGLPDEYDYGYESQGTGRFSLMAGGSWNRVPDIYPDCAGNSPARPGAWALAQLGLVAPTVVTAATTDIVLPPVARNREGSVLKVVYPDSDGREYWLFENRQQMDFDQGFIRMGTRAHGMLVYHVDEDVIARAYWRPNEAECVLDGAYAGTINCDCDALPANETTGERWYGISLEQADGLYELERGASGGNTGDFYPGTTKAGSFTPSTTPNTSSYYRYGGCTGFAAATGIVEVGGLVTLALTDDVHTYPLAVAVVGRARCCGIRTWRSTSTATQ